MNTNYVDTSTNRNYALLATAIFHCLLILMLIWFNVSQPDPPLTASEGMVVNLGYVDESTGDIQPISDKDNVQPIVTHEQIKANQTENEKIVTQSIEETEAIKSSEKVVEKVTENNASRENQNNETKEEQPQPQVNPMALYKGKKNNSTNQGTSDKGVGDQGDPNGDPFSNNYGKNTGSGNGLSAGSGTGGVSHTLHNRKAENLMKPEYECNESGTVIVEIWVNQYGKVIRARAGSRGSTTTSTCLYSKAENAAYKTRFNSDPDAPEEQRGTIIYNFSLK